MKNLTLLFIDSHFEKFAGRIDSAADKNNCEVMFCNSTKDGLNTFDKYADITDAVLIDQNIDGGELKSFDILYYIKKRYPDLYVFLLSENVKKELELSNRGFFYDTFDSIVIEDIYNGDFFKKLIESKERRINEIKTFSKSTLIDIKRSKGNEPFVAYFTSTGIGDSLRAFFGYKLQCITSPSSSNDQERFINDCIEWHKHLLSTFHYSGEGHIFNLRFTNYPVVGKLEHSKMEVVLMVLSKANDMESLRKNVNQMIEDLSLFINSDQALSKIYYFFKPIVDEKSILTYYSLANIEYSASFSRKMKRIEKQNIPIGFQKREESNKSINGLYASNGTTLDLGKLFTTLLSNNEHKVIDIILQPCQLSKAEIDEARRIVQNYNPVDFSLDKEIVGFYEKFLTLDVTCFDIRLLISQKKKTFNNAVLSEIANCYFFNPDNCEITFAENINIYDKTTNESNDFKHYYTLSDAIHLFRLPFPKFGEITGIKNIPSSHLYYPSDLSQDGILMGERHIGNVPFQVRINKDDLGLHTYILGQTGTGKTTLLFTMIKNLINSGNGVCLIDPHGDVTNEILDFIPEDRKNDLIFFIPVANPQPHHINILDYDPNFPEQKTVIYNTLIDIFNQEYDMKIAGGPMFESYFKNAVLLVMESKPGFGTLMDVVKLFQDRTFRDSLLSQCDNKSVKKFWETAHELKGDDWSFVNWIHYITSKLNRFTQDDFITPIIQFPISNINFREIIDKRKTLIVKLPKGRMGSEGVRFMGTILFSRIIMAAFSRENIAAEKRIPFYIFVDEFQNFTSKDLVNSLAECRKYGIRLILANQSLEQLERNMVGSIMGNVGNLLFFRPGPIDFDKIEPYLQNSFSRQEMVNLPNHYCVSRIQINNTPTKPFIFKTIKN